VSVFDIFCAIAAIIILITAVARLDDIKRSQQSVRWWMRRIGLLMVSVAMIMLLASYVTVGAPNWVPIQKILGLWGIALTWLTTPGMPPWWKYITRNDSKE
jgi:hypothetical protein